MSDTIRMSWVTTEDQAKSLKDFAATFDHGEFSGDRIASISRAGKLFGYFQCYDRPIIVSAWHPECGARNIREATNQMRTWLDLNYGGKAFMAVEVGHKTFTPVTMGKLGCRRLNMELYDIEG